MNPVTFNDFYRLMAATVSYQDCRKHLGWPHIDQVCASPLFLHDTDKVNYSHMADVGRQGLLELMYDERGVARLPFPILRVCLESRKLDSAWHVVVFEALTGSRELATFAIWNFAKMDSENAKTSAADLAMVHSMRRDFHAPRHHQDRDVVSSVVFLDKRRDCNLVDVSERFKEEFAKEHHAILLGFLYDVLSPSNHIAKVAPDKAGKSVQWKAAREHYVVLDRRHEANKKELQEGARLVQDDGRNRERISHSRRAHWRRFTHERYTKVKGTKTWIKSLWVGPKVWRDLTGSIYQIVR